MTFYLLVVINIFSDEFIHIYVYNLNLETLKHHQIAILKKYYNQFYLHHKNYHNRSKDSSIFIIQPYVLSNENIKLKQYNFYQYILTNLKFDYMHFLDFEINSILKQQSISQYETLLKKNISKILCFNCYEKNSYLYQKFLFYTYQNLKIGLLFFKNCNFSINELEKILFLYQDTNVWILSFAKDKCLIDNFIKIFYKYKSTFLLFNTGKNKFYKYEQHVFNCTLENIICHIKIKYRENSLLNLENQFVKIYNYE